MALLANMIGPSLLAASAIALSPGQSRQPAPAEASEHVPIAVASLDATAGAKLVQVIGRGMHLEWAFSLSPAKPLSPVKTYQGALAAGQLVDGRYFRFMMDRFRLNPPELTGIRLSAHSDGLGLDSRSWPTYDLGPPAKTLPIISGYRHLVSKTLFSGIHLGIWKARRGKPSLIFVRYGQANEDSPPEQCIVATSNLATATLHAWLPMHYVTQVEVLGSRSSGRQLYLLRYSFVLAAGCGTEASR